MGIGDLLAILSIALTLLLWLLKPPRQLNLWGQDRQWLVMPRRWIGRHLTTCLLTVAVVETTVILVLALLAHR